MVTPFNGVLRNRMMRPAITQITPFTYRDGVTYLELLYKLVDYVTGEMSDSIKKLINDLEQAIKDIDNDIDSAINDVIEYIDEQINNIIDSNIEIVDPVVAGIISGNGATRSVLDSLYEAKRNDVFYARNEGLVGDWIGTNETGSGTDDSAALQALIARAAPGSTIMFERDKRYRLKNIVSTKPLTLDFNGADVIVNTRYEGREEHPAIEFSGAIISTYSADSMMRGSTRISVTDSHNIKVGDVVNVGDLMPLEHWADGHTFAMGRQFTAEVISVDGAVIGLNTYTPWDLTVSPYVDLVEAIRGAHVKNATIYEINPGVPQAGTGGFGGGRANVIAMRHVVGGTVSDVNLIGWNGVGIHILDCSNIYLSNNSAKSPFRPELGGSGHVVRFIRSIDCENYRMIGWNKTRHISNYVQAIRCGSRDCVSHQAGNYQSHGFWSVDCYSIDDKAIGFDSTGWQVGNEPYGFDDGFKIIRPYYRGRANGYGIVARTKSRNIVIVTPDIRCYEDGRGINISEGCYNITVDGRGGRVTTNGANPLSIRGSMGGASFDVGRVDIIGDCYEGGLLYLISGSRLNLDGIPPQKIEFASGSGTSAIKPVSDLSSFKVTTFDDAPYANGAVNWYAANGGFWCKVKHPGTIRSIGLHVINQSGNISVAVYRGGGVRENFKPTERVATSGVVACPDTGYREIPLQGGRVSVEPGDWLFLSADTTAFQCLCVGGYTSDIFAGLSYRGGGHPAPATAPSSIQASSTGRPLLVGVF